VTVTHADGTVEVRPAMGRKDVTDLVRRTDRAAHRRST